MSKTVCTPDRSIPALPLTLLSLVALVLLLGLFPACSLPGKHAGESGISKPSLPLRVVESDDTVIRESCVIRIPKGTVLRDANGNGVLQIVASNIRVQFEAGSSLWGQSPQNPWDQATGIGIRIQDQTNVVLSGAQVHGFRCGLVATRASGLRILGGDFSDNFRQRLKSDATKEDAGDWLFPHHNDERLWRDEYGGAVCVERSEGVRVSGVHVRRGQNGILFDQVNASVVERCDCSFLSGWGLALWRSSRNQILGNAFDFCVRGHVEGVYNRGQDSAGILCFEQSSENVFSGNSATHGGDGFFGFAGREAIGELWMEAERDRLRRSTGRQDVDALIQVPEEVVRDLSPRGCNRNIFVGNDFSYASAHGFEMTFSEGNMLVENRFVENAICGIWGGYSSGMLIAGNEFVGNGGMAYGLERGAINMEHASDNLLVRNRFVNDKCGIHLWWDEDGSLLRLPGVSGSEKGVTGNVIAGNQFEISDLSLFGEIHPSEQIACMHWRDSTGTHVTNNQYGLNTLTLKVPRAVESITEKGCAPQSATVIPSHRMDDAIQSLVKTRAGHRPQFKGRHQIVMDEWGPWDHEHPMVRERRSPEGDQLFECFGFSQRPVAELTSGAGIALEWAEGTPRVLRLRAQPGFHRYVLRIHGEGLDREYRGALLGTTWDVRFFEWPASMDPRQRYEDWKQLLNGPGVVTNTFHTLDFTFGMGGPAVLNSSLGKLRADRFGMLARTVVPLPKGTWKLRTMTDDGIRVRVGDKIILENWTWHGPTEDTATFEVRDAAPVLIEVEYFEIDGYAVMRLQLEPANGREDSVR